MKKIKKFIVVSLLFSLALPVTAASTNVNSLVATSSVNTSFLRDSNGGANPIVKAKWEMNSVNGNGTTTPGTDDSTASGAQFLPSGKYQVGKTISICGLVTDPDGLADVSAVYADVFYPTGINLGPNHEANRQGCGDLIGEISLKRLSKSDGINLLCTQIRNNNNNLPTWNATSTNNFNYDEACAIDGELWKETAAVYCGERTLSYEDPSGDYRTLVMAQDKNGLDGTLENTFRYLDLTAFETDFQNVNYGNVKLNTHKIINGDLTWNATSSPSVRNVGNTRLNMAIFQDDMGLGKTDSSWNVRWDARVGSDAAFKNYNPETWTTLNNALDLSETEEMDFSIDIFKFPPTHDGNSFSGKMILSAIKAPHLICEL